MHCPLQLKCTPIHVQVTLPVDSMIPPHFHAKYNGHQILVDIEENVVIKGVLPANKLKLVLGWAELHHNELVDCWNKAKLNQMPTRIEPLH